MDTHFNATLEFSIDLVHDSFVITFSKKDLKDSHLLYNWLSLFIDVGSEEEFLFSDCISLMSSVKILFEFWDGDVEVNVLIFMKNSGDDVNENAVGCILISSEWYFHGSELDSPSDVIINGYF